MSSKLEIDVRVRTEEAAADVNKLKGDLADVKNAGKTPVKIKIDTADAQKRVTDIKTALKQLQLGSGAESALGGALGEISQEARSLTANMTGATKSIADLGIASGLAAANALGPWGQFAAAVVGAIGFIQRLEREQEVQITQTRQLQQLQGDLGARYNALSQNIATTATTQERFNIISQRVAESFRTQISLANQLAVAYANTAPRTRGLSAAQQADRDAAALTRAAEQALPEIQRLRGSHITLNDVVNDQGALLRNLGIEYTATGNASVDLLNRTAALARMNEQNIRTTVQNITQERNQAEERRRNARRLGEYQEAQQNLNEVSSRLRTAEASLSDATRETAQATSEAERENTRYSASLRDTAAAAGELEEKNRRAANTTAAATAQQLRESRRRIFDVVAETQFDERMRVLRAGTDERQRATQQFRNLIAEEQYRQQQSARAIELARLEEDLQRTGRQRDENEAQRQERLANAQSRYNQIRRESLEAQDADATRRRELAEQEKTQAMETANAVRAAYDLQLQGSQQLIAAQEQQRIARQNLANSSLTQEQIERRAVQQGLDALPAIREQLSLVNQRIEAARERGAAETEINRLIIERMGLETQAMSVEAEAGRTRERQRASIETYRKTMEEAAGSMTQALTGAATAAIFAGDNIGEALQAALASTLQQVATESAVKALFETAKGIAAVATGLPTAPLHFAAAGKFAATAVAAGAVGAAIAPESGATASATGTPSAAPRGEAPTRRDESELSSPKIINISLNAFQSSEQAQSMIVRTLREAGYNSGRSAPRT